MTRSGAWWFAGVMALLMVVCGTSYEAWQRGNGRTDAEWSQNIEQDEDVARECQFPDLDYRNEKCAQFRKDKK